MNSTRTKDFFVKELALVSLDFDFFFDKFKFLLQKVLVGGQNIKMFFKIMKFHIFSIAKFG
jgi:hypothetical protein